ncbi:hypothetical protein G4B88_003929 [Cannabis sativa]|uniref:Uncharacterized protein n=2 Tax=Cannabis sativa TaxID=3483 RepID=A0A7J6GXC5_CANSA|nr:hypothetical protein G4B88_003929 [Cannabis sativa]
MAKIPNKPFKDHHDNINQYTVSSNKARISSSSRNNNFLCCFGFSGKKLSGKINSPQENMIIKQSSININDTTKNKKKKISWPARFRKKSPTGIKTVPVDYSDKDWSKPKSKSTDPTAENCSSDIQIVVPAVHDPPPKEKTHQDQVRINGGNLENRKPSISGPLHSPKGDTGQSRFSFSRKIEAIRNGSSQPGSPSNGKSKLGRASAVMTRQHSDILPLPIRERPQVAPTKRTAGGRRSAQPADAKRFEPLVGMSILLVTLVIMVLWGRVCAILCTSAWFYFVPWLSAAVGTGGGRGNGSGSEGLDLDSEESKKKVVFEGFLERNYHRFNS